MSLRFGHLLGITALVALAAGSTAPGEASGQMRGPVGPGDPSGPGIGVSEAAPVIEPFVSLQRRLRAGTLGPLRSGSVLGDVSSAEGIVVLLRFSDDGPLPAPLRETLTGMGVELRGALPGGESLGGVRRAFVPWQALNSLRSVDGLQRVEAARRPGRLAPLEVTTTSIGAAAARASIDGPDGAGTLLAQIDSPVDIAHPAFFRADGGLYRWIDVDGDGAFEPGVDAVDLDRDGRPDRNETLRLLDAVTVIDDGKERRLTGEDERLQPTRDWLYADMNGDRTRNKGREAGFVESDPGFGEPLFVVDDVDRDGRLQPREALVQLGSSKISAMHVGDTTYRRDESLIGAVDAELPARAIHGTGVAGILVGGTPGAQGRVGVAPGADLLVFGDQRGELENSAAHLRAMETAVGAGADVILHEWTNPFFRPLDGSSNVARAMDAARRKGIPQVVPVGNLNDSEKSVVRRVPAGSEATLEFQVPATVSTQNGARPVTEVLGSLQWVEPTDLSVRLAGPGGTGASPVDLRFEDGVATAALDGARLRATLETTDRGTHFLSFVLTADPGVERLREGTWSFRLASSGAAAEVVGRISDRHTGWFRGVGWKNPTPDRTTISYPSTVDSAIGVGAHVGRATESEPDSDAGPDAGSDDGNTSADRKPGRLRAFSGRGPRIDGAAAVDLTGPDNPFVPLAATPGVSRRGGETWYFGFGGTSGAAPHVAGAFALLKEALPEADIEALENRLLEGADTDTLIPDPPALPSPAWGRGRLDIWAALHETTDTTWSSGAAPRARLDIERRGEELWLDASASIDPEGEALSYRFDVGYDGRWETDWQYEPILSIDPASLPPSARLVRLAVRDPAGQLHGTLAAIPSPDGPGGPDDAGGAASADVGPDVGPPDAPPGDPSRGCGCRTASRGGTTGFPRIESLLALFAIAALTRARRYDRGIDADA